MAKKKITHKILVPTKDGGYVNFNDLSEEQKQHIRNQCFTRFADSYMGQLGYTRSGFTELIICCAIGMTGLWKGA